MCDRLRTGRVLCNGPTAQQQEWCNQKTGTHERKMHAGSKGELLLSSAALSLLCFLFLRGSVAPCCGFVLLWLLYQCQCCLLCRRISSLPEHRCGGLQ